MTKRIIVFSSAPAIKDRKVDIVVSIYTTGAEQFAAVWEYLAAAQWDLLTHPDSMPQLKHCEVKPGEFVLALQQHGGHSPNLLAKHMHSYFSEKFPDGKISTVYTACPRELAGVFKLEEEVANL